MTFLRDLISISRSISAMLLLHASAASCKPYPIEFSIPESKIVKTIPAKTTDFAPLIPAKLDTYIYTSEQQYYADYQQSYFALTCRRGGWDCLRHYEILANGCIPYFVDLDQCPEETLYFFPKELIKEAMQLEGVSYPKIDHLKFDKTRYYQLLNQMLDHFRHSLTCRKMAEYLLHTAGYSGNGKILYLSNDVRPDYLRCLTLIGLKECLGELVIDIPKIEHIYKSYPGDTNQLYGKGFTYSKLIDDLSVDRGMIENRIRNQEFELIIYGSIHRGHPYDVLVRQVYDKEKIVYLCGEDQHQCEYSDRHLLFLREFPCASYPSVDENFLLNKLN